MTTRTYGAVAKSLRITRSTYVLVAALTAGITANAMVAIQFQGLAGQATLFALAFVSVAVATCAVSADMFSRSRQVVDNLLSMGAKKGTLSRAVLATVFTYGTIGSLLGVLVGAGVGYALSNFTSAGVAILSEAVTFLIVSAGATTAGVYTGVGVAWRS